MHIDSGFIPLLREERGTSAVNRSGDGSNRLERLRGTGVVSVNLEPDAVTSTVFLLMTVPLGRVERGRGHL